MEQRIPTQCPRYLYKYAKVNSYTKALVTKGELYFASPAQFNDPFDCIAYIDVSSFTLVDLAHDYETIKRKDGEAAAYGFLTQMLDHDQRARDETKLQSVNKVVRGRIGVCCLSEVNDNILMWSHYSDCHRGVCIRIDIEQLRGNDRRLYPVIYSESYPHYDLVGPHRPAQMLANLLTKATDWSYEREWRAFKEGAGVKRVPPRAVSSVVLGCQISSEDEATVRSWTNERRPKPSIYRAERKEREFGLDIRHA